VHLAGAKYGVHRAVLGGAAVNVAGLRQIDGDTARDATKRLAPADDAGDRFFIHAILQRDHVAVAGLVERRQIVEDWFETREDAEARLAEVIETRLVLPLAIFQAVTGVGLIWVLGINVLDVKAFLWLDVGIILYVIALAIVLRIAIPTTVALIEATNAPPPPPAPGSPAPSGPPPHIAALVKRQRQFGQIITLLLVLIIILMVTKPHLT